MALSVRYMGSKRSMAPRIAQRITREHPEAVVLDVFAGMCAVGTQLAPRHTIMTNDIHAFAETVARALFVASATPPTSLHARDELLEAYRANFRSLQEAVQPQLDTEAEALARAHDFAGWKRFVSFTQRELQRGVCVPPAVGTLSDYQGAPTRFPFCLATSHFASSYFGLRQCLEIDSLRYAIAQGPFEKQPFYLTALLQAMSQCAAAPGHFAQFLVPRDKKNSQYIARIRCRSVLERFYSALDAIEWPSCKDRTHSRTFCSDATDLLADGLDVIPKNFVIYADPPYSRAQYSRYYHVLESIVLYDYPGATGKGRYRGGRVQTGFSKAAAVEDAFNGFIAAAAKTNAALYLSYPTNGLLQSRGAQVGDVLRQFYSTVRLADRVLLNHSTLGAAGGRATVPVYEDVYYATNR
jgi:adenine-specific DNA-methyltransferase